MDVRGWKRVLLQWVAECGFLEGNYFSLEQTDIDEFYRNFRLNHKMALRTEGKCNLLAFIQEHYRDFQLHLDDENSLSSNDYIYVYSLLLHFCCVKYPETIFHDICKKLSSTSQRCIAAFFNEVLDSEVIDRERLRHAIASVAVKHMGQHSESFSSTSSNSSTAPSSSSARMQSPVRHNRASSCNNSPRMVPPTPKSALLEDRTRELYNLRAQLETERYEKGLLEVQIKQNEEKILKLNHDHRKLQQQIQDLKNDILTKNVESHSPSREGDDQMRRRLCKEIQQKEQEIAKLNEVLGSLREDKCLAQEKLVYAEKQISVCVERIKELDYKVDELTTELERKENTIRCLNDSKLELEQYIAETRSTSTNSRPEYLDASFSPITDSSSPENLGRSVIDVQLREKEHENTELRKEVTTLHERNARLSSQIREFTIKHSQEFNVATAIGTVTAKEEDEGNTQPADYLAHLLDYVQRLGNNYKEDKLRVKNMQTELLAKQKRNEELSKKLLDFEKEMSVLKNSIKSVEQMNAELEQSKQRVQEKVVRCEQEIVKINEQKFELVAKLESLATDYDVHKDKCDTQRENFLSEIEKLEAELERRDKECIKLSETNEELSAEVQSLQNTVQTLQQSLIGCNEEIKQLNERYKGHAHELESHEQTEQMLKEKYEKLLVQHEAMKRDKRETSDHLEAMRNSIAVKELEMSKIGTEIIEVRKKNVELEKRIDALMTEYKNEKKNSDLAIHSRDERIREIARERENAQQELDKSLEELEELQGKFDIQKEQLESLYPKINALNIMLNGDKCDENDNLLENLPDIITKVKELQEFKFEAANKIDLLSFDNTEAITRMHEIEEQLKRAQHDKHALVIKRDQQLSDMRKDMQYLQEKIKVYEEQIECFKTAQVKYAEDLCIKLKMKDEECALRIEKIAEENERVLRAMEVDLRDARELVRIKSQELDVVSAECVGVKQKLGESASQLEKLQHEQSEMHSKHADKLQGLEKKIEQLVKDNQKFIAEIDAFKEEHNKAESRLREADIALNQLSDQLNEENASKSELNVKLEASEIRLLETELKLDGILKEKSHTISGLKTAYESQATVLRRAESQITLLEKTKMKQEQSISSLQESIEKIVEEKERLIKDVSTFSEQIQREQKEKATLLCSLEQTADQLKAAIDEKDRRVSLLDRNCAELRLQLQEASEDCAKLQNEVSSKEMQLRHVREDHEHERDSWQTKLSELMRRVAEQSVELETHETILIKLTSTIESNAMLSSLISLEADGVEVDNIFNVDESELDTNAGRLKVSLNRLMHSMMQLHAQLHQTEQKRQGAVEVLEKANDKLNGQLLARKTEIAELQLQLASERKISVEAERVRGELEEMKLTNTKLHAQIRQLQRDCETTEQQYQSTLATVERLEQEKVEIKSELQRANENVTRLIQGSESMRQEKEAVMEELQQLRKQLEQTGEYQSIAEAKVKSLTQSTENFEEKLQAAEQELVKLRAQVAESQRKKDDLHSENAKLLEAQEACKKRIEKLAIKLGDTQARCAKLEHDNEKLNESMTSTKTNAERLQREKSNLESEKKSLLERLNAAERSQHQLNSKLQLLERANVALTEEKQQLEASELDAKTKLTKLEKIRQANEEKIRKLNYALETSESTNVRLNHEIGAINSQLNEVKNAASVERAEQLEEINKQRDEALARVQEYEALTQKLQAEASQLQEQNSNVKDQLSKVSITLHISQEKVEALAKQLQQLEADMTQLKEQKQQVEAEHKDTCVKLLEYETQNDQLLAAQRKSIATLEAEVEQLQTELETKAQEIMGLQEERKLLRDCVNSEAAEVERLRKRLDVAELMIEAEQKSTAQLRLDNQILQAKYRESKQRLLDETQSSEERIKENRLEMEGKLDKMKNKMKTLYTEEITKMRTKQEREIANMKTDMDGVKGQNAKYEEHIRKLSNQIVRLNERILEQQKQNAILSTKLKHMQDADSTQFKRPSSIFSAPTGSSTTLTSGPGACGGSVGTNLTMEDEEGEVFNNTYLTDLQTGRMSMSRDVCAEELQYRNSLLPPHLKSTYAAQYDHGLPEDELKDGPHSLDDSLIGLLSTTASNTRARKLTGITNYKRPGPPTPSKHGGRLSLGGNGEPPREILKEANDGSSNSSAVTKTPVRFGFFSSRFSIGNGNRDEHITTSFLKAVQQKKFHSMCLAKADALCTSTPRKSRMHFDQRCLLDQFMALATPPQLLSLAVSGYQANRLSTEMCQPVSALRLADVSSIKHERAPPSHLKMLEQQRVARKRRSSLLRQRISRRMRQFTSTIPKTSPSSAEPQTPQDNVSVTPGTTTTTGTTGTTTSPSASSSDAIVGGARVRGRRRAKRDRGPRLSLYSCGNNFSTCRTPTRANVRDQMRRKAHKQRIDNYNRSRMLTVNRFGGGDREQWEQAKISDVLELDTGIYELPNQNNNYTLCDKNRLSETIVLGKCNLRDRQYSAEQFDSVDSLCEADRVSAANGEKVRLAGGELPTSLDSYYNSAELNEISQDLENKMKINCFPNDCNDCFDDVDEAALRAYYPFEVHMSDEKLVAGKDSKDFAVRSEHFEQVRSEKESHAPFEVHTVDFDAISSPREEEMHAVSSMQPESVTINASHLSDEISYGNNVPSITISCTLKPSEAGENAEKEQLERITLADMMRLWLQIWERMDQTMRLTIIFIVFAPISAIVYLLTLRYP